MMSLLLNLLFRFVIAFLPRSKYLLISCLQSLSTVILEPKKRKSVTASTLSPSICHEVMGLDGTGSVFSMLSFKQLFHLVSNTFVQQWKNIQSEILFNICIISSNVHRLHLKAVTQSCKYINITKGYIIDAHEDSGQDPPRNQRTAFYFFRLNCIIFLDV